MGTSAGSITRSIIEGTTASTLEACTSAEWAKWPILYNMACVNRGRETTTTTEVARVEELGVDVSSPTEVEKIVSAYMASKLTAGDVSTGVVLLQMLVEEVGVTSTSVLATNDTRPGDTNH